MGPGCLVCVGGGREGGCRCRVRCGRGRTMQMRRAGGAEARGRGRLLYRCGVGQQPHPTAALTRRRVQLVCLHQLHAHAAVGAVLKAEAGVALQQHVRVGVVDGVRDLRRRGGEWKGKEEEVQGGRTLRGRGRRHGWSGSMLCARHDSGSGSPPRAARPRSATAPPAGAPAPPAALAGSAVGF